MVTKLDYYQKKIPGQTTELQDLLDEAEDISVGLGRRDKETLLSFMEQLDSIQHLIQTMETVQGSDLRPHKNQFDTIISRFLRAAGSILTTLGGATTLHAIRPEGAAPETHPWWFVDHYVAERRAQTLRQWMKIGIGLAVVALILGVLFNTVLKPDPAVVEAQARYEASLKALAETRDYETALAEIDQGLAVRPDDFEALILKGIILQLMERPDDAEAVFDEAAALAPSQEFVALGKGRVRMMLGHPLIAKELAEESIALNEEFAEGWFLLGQTYDQLGQTPEAFEAMEKASELALEQENDTLYAIIRVNMGYLAPSGGAPGGGGF